jgi:hypothetical protein
MTKLVVIVSVMCVTVMPALAGASQGGVSRLYQTRCYPGIGCWPLGYEPAIGGYHPAWRDVFGSCRGCLARSRSFM